MKTAIYAIIQKDIRAITANRQLVIMILVVPLVLTLVLPTIFLLTIHFAPEDSADVQQLLKLLPAAIDTTNIEKQLTQMFFNHILPVFFLVIPVMAASVLAAASFVGEKEQHTLETLLYGPLTVGEIFYAKVLGAFLFSMLVSWAAFGVMLLTLEAESILLGGGVLVPGTCWFAVMLLVSPVISLIAITLIVRGSARAQNMMEAQQKAVFLVLPLVALVVSQFAGVMLVSVWLLTAIGLVLLLPAWLLLRASLRFFRYEKLLL